MKTLKFTLIALAALFMLGCNSGSEFKDIQVTADHDPDFKLKNYATYAWLGSAEIIGSDYGQWEPPNFDADSEIRFLIDDKLRDHNLKPVKETPDLIVAFVGGVDVVNVLDVKKNPDMNEIDLKQVPKGALVIVFIDGRSGEPVWIGEATANVQYAPDEKTAKKRLDYAVQKMLKKIPD